MTDLKPLQVVMRIDHVSCKLNKFIFCKKILSFLPHLYEVEQRCYTAFHDYISVFGRIILTFKFSNVITIKSDYIGMRVLF